MFEKENQVKNLDKSSKKNLCLALIAIICLLLSLTVFYPMSMKVDKYSNTILIILAYSFYILQGTSFILTIVTFTNGVSYIKAKKDARNYLVLTINLLLFVMFGYEVYWLLNHL